MADTTIRTLQQQMEQLTKLHVAQHLGAGQHRRCTLGPLEKPMNGRPTRIVVDATPMAAAAAQLLRPLHGTLRYERAAQMGSIVEKQALAERLSRRADQILHLVFARLHMKQLSGLHQNSPIRCVKNFPTRRHVTHGWLGIMVTLNGLWTAVLMAYEQR